MNPVLELYHFGFSTCSQKVRLVLAEKGLEFTSHEVNLMAGEQHADDYVKLNPKHVVPTLVHDGRVLVESSLIVKYLDDAFPEPPMRPADAAGRYAVDRWLMHLDAALHPAAPIVTFAIGPWLTSDRFGLADASLLPYVLRLEHLAMDPVLAPSVRPRVADWLARVKALPAYAAALDAWTVPAVVDMLRANGKEAWPEVEPLT